MLFLRRIHDNRDSLHLTYSVCLAVFVSIHQAESQANSWERAQTVAKSIDSFGLKLFKILASDDQNLVFSPFSLHTALSLVYMGAKDPTAPAMRQTLDILDTNEDVQEGVKELLAVLNEKAAFTLETANKIYVGKTCALLPEFQSVATNAYGATAENIDFEKSEEAARTINSWVEEKTKEKIKNLVTKEDFGSWTKLVLVNAVYFLGRWLHEFMNEATTEQDFSMNTNEIVKVQMMHETSYYNYTDQTLLKSHVVQLPYKGTPEHPMSMLIIVPKEINGIDEALKMLDLPTLQSINSQLKFVNIDLSLPKFKFERTIEFNDILKKIGMAIAFEDEGNLENICPETKKIDKVMHKAFIELTEQGTEAAAATVVFAAGATSIGPPVEAKVVADHPFIFLIQEESTGTVLFMGTVTNPTTGTGK